MTLKELLLEFDTTDLDKVSVDDISMFELESLEKVEKDPKILKKIDEIKRVKIAKERLTKTFDKLSETRKKRFEVARKKDGLE